MACITAAAACIRTHAAAGVLTHPCAPADDHRIFVGDLGKEVSDDVLTRAFMRFPSFLKAKVVKNTSTGATKGYGFVSFGDLASMVRALKEMDGKYIGNRPCKLKKSTWQARDAGVAVVGPDRRVKTKDVKPATKRKHVATLQD
jgi:RNA recognition motif-containing protein